MSESIALMKQMMEELSGMRKTLDKLTQENTDLRAQVTELSKAPKTVEIKQALSNLDSSVNKTQELSKTANGRIDYLCDLLVKYAEVTNYH